MGIYFCHIMIGIVGAILFSLLFINFDKTWKKGVSALFTFALSGGGVAAIYKSFGQISPNTIFYAIGIMILSFIITFVLTMLITAFLIKDKDDNDVIRIRDILLGQKAYIDRYYANRHKEITNIINPELNQREKDILTKESELEAEKQHIQEELRKLDELGSKKQKILLPEKKYVVVSKEYLDALPSYVGDLSTCINDMNIITEEFLNKEYESGMPTMKELKSYLLDLAIFISKDLFRTNDVRIHFRNYDSTIDAYKMLLAITGEKLIYKDMTIIPYAEANMIKKSCECRRALIKSMNPKYDYRGNNYTIWQDYMTFTFYNIKKNDKACLSFGISVKNAARYRNLFIFMNHSKFEVYLQENLERINDKYNLANILYE